MAATTPGPARGIGAARLAMRLVAFFMPRDAGRRWLVEADGFLDECGPHSRPAAARSWLRGAPRLVGVMWAGEMTRRARQARSGTGRPTVVVLAPRPRWVRQVMLAGAAAATCLIAGGAFVAGEHHQSQPGMTILTGRAYVGDYQAAITVGNYVYGLQGVGNVQWLDSQGSTHSTGWPACLTGPGQYHWIKFGEVPITEPDGAMTRQIVWVDCQS
jgi:hypothetical protein